MLALALGHADVDKMLASLTSRQLSEWQCYMNLTNEATRNAEAEARTNAQVSAALSRRGRR